MVETRSGLKVDKTTSKKRKEKEVKKHPKKIQKKEEEKGEEIKTVEESQDITQSKGQNVIEPEILEKGLIYFFYKPKVEHKEAHGLEDVQRLYLLLWPAAPPIRKDEKEMKHHVGKMGIGQPERLIVIGRKKLPDVHGKHQRFWGFIEKVSQRLEEIEEDLEPRAYTTRTRGERHVEGARPIGEGVYALIKHHGHIHLAYVLELPEEPHEIQKTFNITKEGSFIVSVKNPDKAAPVGSWFRSTNKASYPEGVKKLFLSEKTKLPLRFAPAQPQLLDYEGGEVLFIGVAEDLKKEFGDTGEYIEELEHLDARKITSDKIWKELHMSKAEHPAEPLVSDKWK